MKSLFILVAVIAVISADYNPTNISLGSLNNAVRHTFQNEAAVPLNK